jgi:hypothetical protein
MIEEIRKRHEEMFHYPWGLWTTKQSKAADLDRAQLLAKVDELEKELKFIREN